MTPRRKRWIVFSSVTGVSLAVALLLLFSLPLAEEESGVQVVGGRPYSFESESLFGTRGSWQNYTYRGVTFGFHLWCLATPVAGELCGNATEPSGVSYPYSFSDGPPSPTPAWQTWNAHDAHEAVQYREGGIVHLLVAE